MREVLSEEGRYRVNIETIQRKVAEHFDVRVADLKTRAGREGSVLPRQIAMFLSRQMTESPPSAIAEAFGGRDPGVVVDAYRSVRERMETDAAAREAVTRLRELLGMAGERNSQSGN